MAGKRKAEGIALLSVYAGSDDDDDAPSESSDEEEASPRRNEQDGGVDLAADVGGRDIVSPASAPRAGVRVDAAGPGIVDYAHDETAASPESEEDVDVGSSGRPLDIELHVDNGNVPASPNGIHDSTPSKMTPKLENNVDVSEADQFGQTAGMQDDHSREGNKEQEQALETAAMEHDILNDFLPPPPAAKYAEELQTKFAKYLALKKTGRSLNEQLRNTKGYRNPDFLQRAVKYHEIDQIGSGFRKEVFDPYGFDPADFYDALALEQRRETDRKDQERKQSQCQRVDFVRSGIHATFGVSKPTLPLIHKALEQRRETDRKDQERKQSQSQRVDFVRSGIQATFGVSKPTLPLIHKVVTVTTTTETLKVDGRPSKKSKWDKVELEGRSAQSIAVDSIAAASVHAALLSASAGYASFAQQRRREAEEKLRATEKNGLTSSSSSSKVEKKKDSRS